MLQYRDSANNRLIPLSAKRFGMARGQQRGIVINVICIKTGVSEVSVNISLIQLREYFGSQLL